MKNLIILVLFLICISPVSASEITGSISTDPNNLEPLIGGPMAGIEGDEVVDEIQSSLGGGLAFLLNGGDANIVSEENDEVIVLGFEKYPDNSLLRGSDAKIYLIEGNYKKHIKTLEELSKYSGQIIFDIENEYLVQYQTRTHLDGDLIRAVGEFKIFHIINGELEHILNLEELRANFAGQEIFNISEEEMLLYRNF